jgi:hypothetical protein
MKAQAESGMKRRKLIESVSKAAISEENGENGGEKAAA